MMLSDGVASSSDTSPPASPSMSNGKAASIVHRVSKLDTLAGIAIKYGVEVSQRFSLENPKLNFFCGGYYDFMNLNRWSDS